MLKIQSPIAYTSLIFVSNLSLTVIFPESVFNSLGRKSIFGVIPMLNNAISKSTVSPLSNFTDFATLFSEIISETPEFNFNVTLFFSISL